MAKSLEVVAAALFATVLAAPIPAIAAEISGIELGDGVTAIFIVGDIKDGDAKQFRSEAGKHEEAIVFLESDGGLTAEAIEIGEAIRLKGFATSVVNGSQCNSACALIWLAGTPRSLAKSARIGFHATYIEEGGKAAESGVGNAIVGRYLTLLNLPERAVIFATTAPPSGMNWLNSTNYESFGIGLTVVDDVDFGSASPSSESSKAQTTSEGSSSRWANSGFWSIMVDHTLNNGCFAIAAFDNDTTFRIGFDATDSRSYYFILRNQQWRSLKLGNKYNLVFQFGSEDPWDVPVAVVDVGEEPVLMRTFSDATFWQEFVSATALYITRDGGHVTNISLAGTKLAFEEMIRCQKAQIAEARSDDPFAE